MKMIKWASDIMWNNLCEARKYICKAYELQSCNRAAADWCRDMAAHHLDFNGPGHTLVKRLIDEYTASGEHSELAPGMRAVYEDKHNDMIRETAEIMAMISAYK